MKYVEIFSDGGCRGNPGPGGFGTILRCGQAVKELSGGEEGNKITTNNRMELMGVITGLEALKEPCSVLVTTDSAYVVNAFEEKWIEGWLKRGWKNSQKKAVLNRDLWERLLAAMEGHEVNWKWVKGHNGHAENERCDELANLYMDMLPPPTP